MSLHRASWEIAARKLWSWSAELGVGARRTLCLSALGAAVGLALSAPQSAQADPHSAPVQLLSVRVYSSGNSSSDFFTMTTTASTVCSGANVFSMPLATIAGQGMLANAITALTTSKYVTIEVSNTTGCTSENNSGPQLQSLTLLATGYSGPW